MATNSSSSMIMTFVPLILFFFVLWFLLIRPQRKQDKEARDMRNSLVQGDEIVTIGGIVGTIVNVKEDSVVIYCGSDKVKIEFKKWAIREVTKKKDAPKKDAAKDSSAAEKKAEKKNEEQTPKFRKLERKEEE